MPKWYDEEMAQLDKSLASGKITEKSYHIAVWELNADLYQEKQDKIHNQG